MTSLPLAYALHRAMLATPIGIVELVGDDKVLRQLIIHPEAPGALADEGPPGSPVARAIEQLSAYFAGTLRTFDLPLAPPETPRGPALRAAIASVPYGETLSYGALARQHGTSSRAMGQACARNPLPIIVPCHRVTSAAGGRENYSGGNGVATKIWLNAHEAGSKGPET